MTSAPLSLPVIQRAINDACAVLQDIDPLRFAWTELSENRLWRELVGCILGSRIRHELAQQALHAIARSGLLNWRRRSSNFRQYERDLRRVLKEGRGRESRRYPLASTRAAHIRRAAERFADRRSSIHDLLQSAPSVVLARRKLVADVAGIGPKQASLFLRNIGFTDQIAVLDSHILTYMNWAGIGDYTASSVASISRYEALESRFVLHAQSLGHAPHRFDIAVWVVVRVTKGTRFAWQ